MGSFEQIKAAADKLRKLQAGRIDIENIAAAKILVHHGVPLEETESRRNVAYFLNCYKILIFLPAHVYDCIDWMQFVLPSKVQYLRHPELENGLILGVDHPIDYKYFAMNIGTKELFTGSIDDIKRFNPQPL